MHAHPGAAANLALATDENPDDAVDAVKKYLGRWRNHEWLLVYDDYDPPENLDDFDLKRFLPEGTRGHIIITSKSAQLNIGHQIHVGKLPEPEVGVQLVSFLSGRQNLTKGKV
jgi:hypothetical protein